MSKPRPKTPPETPGQRLARIIVPGTTGGIYTLIPGALGFFVVLGVYVHSYATGKPMPDVTGEMLLATVSMLGVHTARAVSADRANAANGIAPVPVDPTDPAVPVTVSPAPSRATPPDLPDLRPFDP